MWSRASQVEAERDMAAKGRLKVFRTAIGFEDAYVAATSRKAALEAWGTSKDLFARGAADVVDDPALTKDPLARPGQVVRVKRGSLAQHLAAAAPKPQRRPSAKSTPSPGRAPQRKEQRKPRPSRATLDKAEKAVEAAAAHHEQERRRLAEEIARLRSQQDRLAARQEAAIALLEARRDAAAARYRTALSQWNDET
jgi:hypothetical protein